MMSLGVSKGRVIPPTDEDRRRIIKQMKVRTTLKGDKSWIHHQNSDSEEEKKSSPLSERADGGSSVSAPQSDRSSASKPQSGYLIRGVFTRTIDKTPSLPDSSSKEAQKSTAVKGSNQCRSSSGYRMTTEDYKKLAPYNVKQRSLDLDEEDVPFTPDEHKKRTEAANSVLRRTASRERAYVLSAAKKSNGSPTQEFPPLFAKRIEIEEEGQQRRSSTASDSCKFTPDGNSTETGSKTQTITSLSETSQRISTCSETSYPENTETNNEFYQPNRSNSGCRDKTADATAKLRCQYEMSQYLDDAKSEPARSALQSNVSCPPTDRAPVHPEDTDYYFKRSTQGYEEEDTPRERGHESTRATDEHKSELRSGEFSDSNNHTEKREEPPDHDTQTESPRIAPAYEEQTSSTSDSHHESLGAPGHNEPNPMAASRSNFISKESALSAYETQHPMPLYVDRQPYNTSASAPSHRMPSYLASQVFSTQRPTLDYKGTVYDERSSPSHSRYDSASARGHCEFNPSAGSHYSLSRDTTMPISQRSHRVPFYMDSSDFNSTRLLSSSSERISTPAATLQYNSPAASGYGPDSGATGKGVLFVKEYVNSSELSSSPRYGSSSLVDLTDSERATSSHHSYLSSTPLQRSCEAVCSYCGREIQDCPKIIIEHLNICCHEYCFRCGICHKAMGDLLDKIFIHRDIVHCDKCYEKLF
nr:PREDICTED: zinc finger protein 185 isoform X5 [Struthio camelus australis]